jgi:putrescine transport system permease protein
MRPAPAWGRRLVAGVPLLWLLLFFGLPFAIVLKISLAESILSQPPYSPLLEWSEAGWRLVATLNNYVLLASDSLYLAAFLNSLRLAAIATTACLLIGYPMAYAIARARASVRTPLLMLVILPFWTSMLIRVYAWIALLGTNGPINDLLVGLGLIAEPLPLLHSEFAVLVGIVYAYLPFMILPLYATLVRLDHALLDAAADLGCKPFRAFLAITLPQSWPGIAAGSLLVFVPAVGEVVIPDLLGGPDTLMIGKLLWIEFFNNHDWPLASAVATAMLLLLMAPIVAFQRLEKRQTEERT